MAPISWRRHEPWKINLGIALFLMPRLMPCKRREFIRKLRALGYVGPFPGSNHASMSKGSQTVRVPNTDIDDIGLLKYILKVVTIDETDFINA
jgi:hypothetical protein